jgi:tetratricopeptide (TPR) repeat protein
MLETAMRLAWPGFVAAAAAAAAWAACAAPVRADPAPAPADDLPNFDALWDFSDPAATEARFREILPRAEASGNVDYLAQLWTQIARTLGLRRQFDESHRVLDRVESMLTPGTKTARVRCRLERGRAFRSAKEPAKAKPCFLEAWDLARAAGLDGLAADAGHMMAITEEGDAALAWGKRTLAFAEASKDPAARNWIGVLSYNMGWTQHERGEFAAALDLFRKDLAFRLERKQAAAARTSKWSVARALRSLGRLDDAMALQRELEREFDALPEKDGYVFEEIAEILTAQGKPAEATPYFAKAYALLKDKAESENIPRDRVERMRTRGEVAR